MQSLNVAFFQFDIAWENPELNRNKIDSYLSNADLNEIDLLLLPEMFNTGFSMNTIETAETMNGFTVSWMLENAKKYNTSFAGSLAIVENKKVYNRLVVAQPDGKIDFYDKRHLFVLGNEQHNFEPGSQQLVLNIKGFNVSFFVCYDLRFPVWCRNGNENPSDLYVFVANWPDQRALAWKTLLCARAIENQTNVIGLNRIGEDPFNNTHNGNSFAFNFEGKILIEAKNEEFLYRCSFSKTEIETYRTNFPFRSSADKFNIEI